MVGADGIALAGFAAGIKELAHCALSIPALDAERGLGESFQRVEPRSRLRLRSRGCNHLQGSCRRQRRKRGTQAQAIGRSKGGLTTKVQAAVDALGLPIRFTITPGQWGDCPQAQGLIAGLKGIGHVMADAAYDAD